MKRYGLAFLICAIFLCVCLAACGSEDAPDIIEEAVSVDHVWSTVELALPEDVFVQAAGMYQDAPAVIFSAWGGGEAVYMNCYRTDGTLLESELLYEGGGEAISICIKDNAVLFTVRSYDDNGAAQDALVRWADGGSVTLSEDILADIAAAGVKLDRIITGGVVLIDDAIFLLSEKKLCALTDGVDVSYEVELPGEPDFVRAVGERLLIRYYDPSSRTRVCCYFDPQTRSFSPIGLPDGFERLTVNIYSGPGYELYLDNENSLYGYNAGAEPVELCDWINSDVVHDYIEDVTIIDDASMLVSCNRTDIVTQMAVDSVLYMEAIPEDALPKKQIITLAAIVDDLGRTLRDQIVSFNRQSEEYRVVLIDYGEYEETARGLGQQMLHDDLIAGKTPDILMTNNLSEREAYINDVLFVNLYRLMDDDDDFDRDMLLPCVTEPFEVDGMLYELVSEFGLATYVTPTKNFDGEYWSLTEFLDWAESLPEDVWIGELLHTKEQMLNYLLRGGMDEFTDGRTCSFDNALFRRVLAFAAEQNRGYFEDSLSDAEQAELNEDFYKYYREGVILLGRLRIGDFSDFYEAWSMFGDDEMTFPGYPGAAASVAAGRSFAILRDSDAKEGAWEFLKSIINGAEFNRYQGVFSPSRAVTEEVLENERGRGYIRYHDGRLSRLNDTEPPENFDGSSGVYCEITDAELEKLWEIFESAEAVPLWYDDVTGIIHEEAGMYFAGDKSLDETVKVIQSRCSTYFAEKNES